MRVLKTHSHTSVRQGNEAGKYVHKKMKGRPSLKGPEEIVNESHRLVTRNGRGRRGRGIEERKVNTRNEKKDNTEDAKK